MTSNIPLAVHNLIAEYHSFLRTSYRFLDDRLRQQFEAHLDQTDVVVRGPYVTLARDFAGGPTLRELVEEGTAHPDLLNVRRPSVKNHIVSEASMSVLLVVFEKQTFNPFFDSRRRIPI